MRTILLKCTDVAVLRNTLGEGTSMCSCWGAAGWALGAEPKARGHELLSLAQKGTGTCDQPGGHTQRCGRSWGAQTSTYLHCKGIKPQGFLCSGSSSEAPTRAVTQLMHHDGNILRIQTSKTLLWETWSWASMKTLSNCKRVGVWLQRDLSLSLRGWECYCQSCSQMVRQDTFLNIYSWPCM